MAYRFCQKMKMPLTNVILISALGIAAACADGTDFIGMYSAFGEAPRAEIRPIAEKLVAVSLKDFELKAENVGQAYEKIRDALQAAKHPYGLSLIMREPSEKNYRTPIKIPKATRSFGETINLLCEQADLVWDFSGLKLTFTPNKAESGPRE